MFYVHHNNTRWSYYAYRICGHLYLLLKLHPNEFENSCNCVQSKYNLQIKDIFIIQFNLKYLQFLDIKEARMSDYQVIKT